MATSTEQQARAEQVSALVDGEVDASIVAQACARWRDDPTSRANWHLYQMIGDTLRSEDLASDGRRDAAFLSALRLRLEREPVVLAPSAPAVATAGVAHPVAVGSARARRWSWMAPSAVAAGFVAVAGVLMVTRSPTPQPAGQTIAVAPAGAKALVPVQVAQQPSSPAVEPDVAVQVANGALIRDARLDRYLAAHKQFSGSSMLGVPSAFLRSATATGTDR